MTATHPEPPPKFDVVPLSAAQLERDMVVIVHTAGQPNHAQLKTVAVVSPNKSAKYPKVHVMFTDATTKSWPDQARLSVTADSLPAAYWRTRFAQLQHDIGNLAVRWHIDAGALRKPQTLPASHETPAERAARASEAQTHANLLAELAGVNLRTRA